MTKKTKIRPVNGKFQMKLITKNERVKMILTFQVETFLSRQNSNIRHLKTKLNHVLKQRKHSLI